MVSKETLRKKIIQKLKNQKQLERRKKSSIIHKKLFKLEEFTKAQCIMCYISRGTKEVETGPIIKKALSLNKSMVLPITMVNKRKIKPVYLKHSKQNLKKGAYGIYEPIDTKAPLKKEKIDLVIVPGLAFDKANNRLGRGKGYYDDFLPSLNKDVFTIGLGFRFQLLKNIPVTSHDIPLSTVITN